MSFYNKLKYCEVIKLKLKANLSLFSCSEQRKPYFGNGSKLHKGSILHEDNFAPRVIFARK